MFNKLAEQVWIGTETFIASATAKDIQTVVKPSRVREHLTDMTAPLRVSLAVQITPCQNRFHSVESSIKSHRNCPIRIGRCGSVKTVQERQVMTDLDQMFTFGRHLHSPLEKHVSLRRKEIIKASPLPKNHIGQERQFSLLVNESALQVSNGINNCQVWFISDNPYLPTLISLHQQNGFNLRNLRNLLNEPLQHFLDAFPSQQRRRSHITHFAENFTVSSFGGDGQ